MMGGQSRSQAPMKPLLVIMNARHIERALNAFQALTIDCAYVSGYTEPELKDVFAGLIDNTDYSHYIITSDDVVVRQRAVDAVLDLLKAGHPVATGWCNHDLIEPGVNIQKTRLPSLAHPTTREQWNWYHFAEVLSYPTDAIPTYFTGMCLTGMSKEMWQQFPFDSY